MEWIQDRVVQGDLLKHTALGSDFERLLTGLKFSNETVAPARLLLPLLTLLCMPGHVAVPSGPAADQTVQL